MGVDTLHLETLYNLGRATKNTSFVKQPATKSWIGAVITALDWARQNNKRLAVHALIHLFNPGLNSFCGPMRGNAMVVNHEGRLTACSEVVDRVNKDWDLFCLGELDKTPKVDVEKLEYLASRTPANMSICENCFAKYICRGGCAYKGLVESGDLFIPDNRHCEFVKNIIPILIKRMVLNS